jgi:hypothetical protein
VRWGGWTCDLGLLWFAFLSAFKLGDDGRFLRLLCLCLISVLCFFSSCLASLFTCGLCTVLRSVILNSRAMLVTVVFSVSFFQCTE